MYNFSYGATASNQRTINPKERKMPLWDPDPSPSLPSRTFAFTSVVYIYIYTRYQLLIKHIASTILCKVDPYTQMSSPVIFSSFLTIGSIASHSNAIYS